jgi:hypothetical protein
MARSKVPRQEFTIKGPGGRTVVVTTGDASPREGIMAGTTKVFASILIAAVVFGLAGWALGRD